MVRRLASPPTFCTDFHIGGDGLVAARHLFYYGYKPTVFFPKRSKNELYQVSQEV